MRMRHAVQESSARSSSLGSSLESKDSEASEEPSTPQVRTPRPQARSSLLARALTVSLRVRVKFREDRYPKDLIFNTYRLGAHH